MRLSRRGPIPEMQLVKTLKGYGIFLQEYCHWVGEYCHWVGFPTSNTPSAYNHIAPWVFLANLFLPHRTERRNEEVRHCAMIFQLFCKLTLAKTWKSKAIKWEHKSSKHTFLVPPPPQSRLEKPCKMLSGKARSAKSSRSYWIREDE